MIDNTQSAWTDARVSTLRLLAAAGFSAAEIARRINEEHGGSLSRSAVIGKLARLKIVKDPAKPSNQFMRQKREATRLENVVELKPRTVKATATAVPLVELREGQCRYECSGQNDPQLYLFYGQVTASDSLPYCAAHHRLCHIVVDKRRRSA